MRLPRFPGSFTDLDRRSMGVIAICLTTAVCLVVFAVGSLDLLEHRYGVTAVYPDAAGLRNGSMVRLAGVDVGEVTSVVPDHEHGQVVVRFEVDDDVHLGPETTADVALSTLLGGQYIRLGHIRGGPALDSLPEDERRIPIERTSVPFTVNHTFTRSTEVVQALDTDQLNHLVSEFADIATDSGPRLDRVLSGLEDVARAFNDRQDVVDELLNSSQQLTDTLADKDQTLVRLIDASQVVLDQIDRRRDDLAAVLGEGSSVVRTMSDVLTQRQGELDRILGRLDTLTDIAAEHQQDVNQILAWSGPTYTQVSAITGNGPFIDSLPIALGPDIIAVLNSIYPQLGLDGSVTP